MDLMAEEQKDSSSQCSYHLMEYRKQRMQEKGAKRKTFVVPSTINRELGILRNMLKPGFIFTLFLRARQALKENKEKGIPSVFSLDGVIYYEFPSGEITTRSPFIE